EGIRVVTYGSAPDADVHVEPAGSGFVLTEPGHETAADPSVVTLQVPGWHNVLNAAAAYAAATHGLGLDRAVVRRGLEQFTGTRRRFELRGTAGGVRVVDDYAHNPGKVAAALQTARSVAAGGR